MRRACQTPYPQPRTARRLRRLRRTAACGATHSASQAGIVATSSFGTDVSLTVLDHQPPPLAMCIESNVVLCHRATLPLFWGSFLDDPMIRGVP
jgi:hypothetical protein